MVFIGLPTLLGIVR